MITREFTVKAKDRTVNEAGEFTEVRLSDEGTQSSMLLRGLTKDEFDSINLGDTWNNRSTKGEAAPTPAMVTATLPAEDVG